MNASLPIQPARLQSEIDELATFSQAPAPAVTRVLFSPEDQKARAWLIERFRAAGLQVRHDGVGNIFARWEGSDPALPAVATGSHTDAIPNAGKFDGVIGVLGALEAFRALRESGFKPVRSLEIVMFTSEEPTRFGLGCLGSRLLSGALAPEHALALRSRQSESLLELKTQAGYTGDPDLISVRLPAGFYRAFLELHIEQGPLLERGGLDIGAVEKIAAPSAFRFRLEGSGGHAGGVLMPGRRDALLAASEIALAVEKAALESGCPDTVATTGVLSIEPGSINSIPCRALMEIDLRDTDLRTRKKAFDAIQAAAAEICARRKIELQFEAINSDPPAQCDPELVGLILREAEANNLKARRQISRAYHDSLFMALLCPIAMIFIPCRHGYSHRPDEFSSPEQIAAGVQVLAGVMRELARA
jgi:N-carbamoyl-L-amino-acid hydrolase